MCILWAGWKAATSVITLGCPLWSFWMILKLRRIAGIRPRRHGIAGQCWASVSWRWPNIEPSSHCCRWDGRWASISMRWHASASIQFESLSTEERLSWSFCEVEWSLRSLPCAVVQRQTTVTTHCSRKLLLLLVWLQSPYLDTLSWQ